jgi:demethylmenaquinone methyltransferase/2-methoxy-6-polyprenyl-1,4-benzoquinol methylase
MDVHESSAAPGTAASLPPHAPLSQYYGRAEHKSGFLRGIFDRTAGDYDRVERFMALGSGSWYRRQALLRAGLVEGMKVLDVAAGTGMVAREALAIVGDKGRVVGLEPSRGMLDQLVQHVPIPVLRASGERLPIADQSVDFISMGYALRHLSDISQALREFRRVLRPGGTVCLLEITAPRGRIMRLLMRGYLRGIVPCLTRLTARHADSPLLWQYYWDTIDACVPPETVLQAMREAGFSDVKRNIALGIFSEYTGRNLS